MSIPHFQRNHCVIGKSQSSLPNEMSPHILCSHKAKKKTEIEILLENARRILTGRKGP